MIIYLHVHIFVGSHPIILNNVSHFAQCTLMLWGFFPSSFQPVPLRAPPPEKPDS